MHAIMHMRHLYIIAVTISMLINLTGCKEIPPDANAILPPPVNTEIYTILPYDSTSMQAMNWYYKDENGHPDTLTARQVDSLETIVDSAYRDYTKDSTAYQHSLLPLKNYRRQYVAVCTDNGEKQVWVNFLCADLNGDWKHVALSVDDGGKCFFQLFINVTRRKAIKLIPGGSA